MILTITPPPLCRKVLKFSRFSILTAYIRIDSGHYTAAAIYNEEKDNFYLVNDYSNEEITSLEDEIPGIDPDGYPARLSTTVYLVTYEKQ